LLAALAHIACDVLDNTEAELTLETNNKVVIFYLLVGAWAHQQDGWAVRGPWKRRTDAFSLGGEFTWKKDLQ
jgi:hypothetical protein